MKFGMLDGNIVIADDVERGLKCNCICPECGERLVANKGMFRSPYFKHYTLSNCEGSDMTMLHRVGENLIIENKRFYFPSLYTADGTKYFEGGYIRLNNVQSEKSYGNVIPDIEVEVNGKKIFIEVYVTHKVDFDKLAKLRDLGVSTLEIDLSRLYMEIQLNRPDFDFKRELPKYIFGKYNKYWINVVGYDNIYIEKLVTDGIENLKNNEYTIFDVNVDNRSKLLKKAKLYCIEHREEYIKKKKEEKRIQMQKEQETEKYNRLLFKQCNFDIYKSIIQNEMRKK